MLANFFKKSYFGQQQYKCCSVPLTGYQRYTLQIKYYILVSNEIAEKLLEKQSILLNRQESKLIATPAKMCRNTVCLPVKD